MLRNAASRWEVVTVRIEGDTYARSATPNPASSTRAPRVYLGGPSAPRPRPGRHFGLAAHLRGRSAIPADPSLSERSHQSRPQGSGAAATEASREQLPTRLVSHLPDRDQGFRSGEDRMG